MEQTNRSDGDLTAALEAVTRRIHATFEGSEGWQPWEDEHPNQRRVLKEALLPIVVATLNYEDEKPHQAKRDDDVDKWLKRQRLNYSVHSFEHTLLENLLDDYRLHADTGTPLSEDVPTPGGETA